MPAPTGKRRAPRDPLAKRIRKAITVQVTTPSDDAYSAGYDPTGNRTDARIALIATCWAAVALMIAAPALLNDDHLHPWQWTLILLSAAVVLITCRRPHTEK